MVTDHLVWEPAATPGESTTVCIRMKWSHFPSLSNATMRESNPQLCRSSGMKSTDTMPHFRCEISFGRSRPALAVQNNFALLHVSQLETYLSTYRPIPGHQ